MTPSSPLKVFYFIIVYAKEFTNIPKILDYLGISMGY